MTRQLRWTTAASIVVACCMVMLAACQRTPTDSKVSAIQPPAHGQAAPAQDARMASELQRAEERMNLCSTREAKAAGLTAEYFGQKSFKGTPLLARQEGPLDHAWPQVGIDVSAPVRSARWRGWVRPPFTGRFKFHTDLPGARIAVANQALANDDSTVELHAGRYHPIQIELNELPKPDSATAPLQPLKLSWTTPFGARYLLPRAVLYPPSDTVDAGATKNSGK